MRPRIGSLFSGAGGLDLAVMEVFGGEVVWHAELETLTDEKTGKTRPNAAVRVLSHHWPDVPNLGDISAVDWATVEPVDILCGGFPCQDVSSAGLRAGIAEGTRSGLWLMFAKAIAALRPRIVVIENVRGLLHAEAHRGMEPGDTTVADVPDGPVLRAAGAVLGDLADIGYDAQWATVSASSVGAPHQRDRVFILAEDCRVGADTDSADSRDGLGCGPVRGRGLHQLAPEPVQEDAYVGTVYDGSGRSSAVRRHDWSWKAQGSLCTEGTREEANVALDDLGERRRRDGAESDVVGIGQPPSCPCCGGDDIAEAGIIEAAEEPILATDAAGNGWDARRSESARIIGRPDAAVCGNADVALLPTPRKSDGDGGANPLSRAERMDDVETRVIRIGDTWGKYEPAIRRWEWVTRPPPSPTEPNTKGNPRLAPAFPEWMQGFDDGWITAVPGISRNDQLRIIGNSVCPQQAESALRQLIQVCEVSA